MSAHMRKHHTEQGMIRMSHAGVVYNIPQQIAKKYIVTNNTVSPDDVFSSINEQYTKPGALLKGLRMRENITQVEMARRICVTQSDVSQMENGTRSIGRKIAKRIEKRFDVNYRSFLD